MLDRRTTPNARRKVGPSRRPVASAKLGVSYVGLLGGLAAEHTHQMVHQGALLLCGLRGPFHGRGGNGGARSLSLLVEENHNVESCIRQAFS